MKQQTNKQLRKKQKKSRKRIAKKNHILKEEQQTYQTNGVVLDTTFNAEQYLLNMTLGGLLLTSAIALQKEKREAKK